MKFKFIETDDPEYPKALMLRWEVLQKPQGLPPGSQVLPEEEQSLHLLAIEGRKIVGCVLFQPETSTTGKLCQLAISEEYRGRGFIRQIINTLERALFERGIKEVYLQAIEEAIHLYTQMGYELEGAPFHAREGYKQQMKKRLCA